MQMSMDMPIFNHVALNKLGEWEKKVPGARALVLVTVFLGGIFLWGWRWVGQWATRGKTSDLLK